MESDLESKLVSVDALEVDEHDTFWHNILDSDNTSLPVDVTMKDWIPYRKRLVVVQS